MSNFVHPDPKNSGIQQNASIVNHKFNDQLASNEKPSYHLKETPNSNPILNHLNTDTTYSSGDLESAHFGNGIHSTPYIDQKVLNENTYVSSMAGAGNTVQNVENSSSSNSTPSVSKEPIFNGVDNLNSQNTTMTLNNSKEPSSGFMIISLRHETKGKREKRPSNSGFDQPAVLPKKSTSQNDSEAANVVEDRTPSAGEEESDDDDTDENEDEDIDDMEGSDSAIVDGKQSSQPFYVRNPQNHVQSSNVTKVPPLQPVYQQRLNQQPWPSQPKFSQNNGSASIWPNQTGVNSRMSRLNAPGLNSPAVYQEGYGPAMSTTAILASTVNQLKNRSSAEDTPASNITMECSQATSPPNNDYINEHNTGCSEEVNQPASRFRKARIQERIEHWREGRSCFHDCRVKTVPTKVLDLVSAKVDPTLPISVIARCPFCLNKIQELPCGCVDNSPSNNQDGLSRVSSADIQPYLGAFWLHGKRIHLYASGSLNEPNLSGSAIASSTPGETPRLLAEVSTASLTAYDYQSEAFDAQGLSRSESVNSPHSSLDMDAMLAGPTGSQSASVNGPVSLGTMSLPCCSAISDEALNVGAGADNDKNSSKLESPRSAKSGSVVKSMSPETTAGEERRKQDKNCFEQPAPPTSPASGLLDRLVSPGSAVDPHLASVLTSNNRPVQVVPSASSSTMPSNPNPTSIGNHLPSSVTSSIQQPNSLLQNSRQQGIPNSMSTYQDHRPTQQTNGSNPPAENRIETKINNSLEVVRMALMTTFREEIDTTRHEISYLREQNRIQQETYDHVLTIVRSYVPPEIWEQHVAPTLPYLSYATSQNSNQNTITSGTIMTSQSSIPPGGPTVSLAGPNGCPNTGGTISK